MLYRFLVFALLVLVKMPVNAAALKGVILENESSGPPMENITVDAKVGTNLTTTDLSGKFTLEFPHRRIGDTVTIMVEKKGYLVVNEVQLETVLPADTDDRPLTIILAKKEDLEEMAGRYYKLKSFAAIEEKYQKLQQELEESKQATAVDITRLQQERDQAKATAEEASKELAKNQPGQDTELFRKAKRLFLDGKVEEAIELLDDEQIAQEKEQALRKALENAVQALLLKAQLLTTQFKFEKAEKAYREAIATAPDWPEARNAFAWFLIQQGVTVEPARGNLKLKEAVKICQQTLEKNQREKSPEDWAETQNKLGLALAGLASRADSEEGRKLLTDALQAYRSALEVYTKADQPQQWASTQNNFGGALREQGIRVGGLEGIELLAQAVMAYHNALEISTRQDLPQQWAGIQNNLGNALREQGIRVGGAKGIELLDQAVKAYTGALRSTLATICPSNGPVSRSTSVTPCAIRASAPAGRKGLRCCSRQSRLIAAPWRSTLANISPNIGPVSRTTWEMCFESKGFGLPARKGPRCWALRWKPIAALSRFTPAKTCLSSGR